MAYTGEQLRTLRTKLVQAYPTERGARRVASDAGVPTAQIDWSGAPMAFWHSVLEEATKHGRVDAIARVLAGEYPALTGAVHDLEALLTKRDLLAASGGDVRAMDAAIVAAKRAARNGPQLTAGECLGDRYLLVKELGHGGFATVWLAYDRRAGKHVAVKVLHGQWARNDERITRFDRGARALQRIAHPNVVRTEQLREEEHGFHYFVMEYVPGGTLRDAVLEKRVSTDAALHVVLAVGEALVHAHAAGIVHRDVKPANVLLRDDGSAVLTDFDLALLGDSTGGTRTGALGTFLYTAPEVLIDARNADVRSDVFSLGMTALFALLGRELTRKEWADHEVALSKLRCDARVKEVLSKALAEEPGDRHADMASFVATLRAACAGSTVPPSPSTSRVEVVATPPPAMQDAVPTEPWASATGTDGYGRWARIDVGASAYLFRWIPPGRFVMGSPRTEAGRRDDEGPQHEVVLTRGFWLGDTPVTQALWEAVMGTDPSRFKSEDRPVECVSWDDSVSFMAALEKKVPGVRVRLPTEAEWEYACRAGTTTATWAGDLTLKGAHHAPELDAIAWYGGNSGVEFELANGVDSSSWPEKQYPHTRAGTRLVRQKSANAFGLYDMLGNVWEWCADWRGSFTSAPVEDPTGPHTSAKRVLRGGSWISDARDVRVARRSALEPGFRDDNLGFRVSRGQAALQQEEQGGGTTGERRGGADARRGGAGG